jgi:transposase
MRKCSLYLTDSVDVQWKPQRLLPKDFGPWETVYGFRTWRRTGLFQRIHDGLRRFVHRQAGRRAQPSVAILDS